MSYIHQDNGKRFFAAQYLLDFAVALNHGVIGALHQRGNIGVGQVEQIEAAIVNINIGEFWVCLPETER